MSFRVLRPAEVILCHSGADFDGLASMFCAQKLYPAAVPLLMGSPDASVRNFLSAYGEEFPIEQARDVHKMPLRRVILVDVQVPSRLGEFREIVNDPQVEVHVYDHHPPTEEAIRGDVHVVERVGATTTLLLRRLMDRRGGAPSLTPMEATLFALGIYEETGSLTFPETTADDARAVAWLLDQGASLSVVSDFSQQTLREEQHQLLREMLGRLETRRVRGMRIVVASAETDQYVGEAAVVAHRIMDLERPDALFCAVRMRDRVYVVGRSRETGPDVSLILGRMGGGGHPRAASASVPAAAVESVIEELWTLVEEMAHPPLTARDVMSSPVQAITLSEEGPTVAEAQRLFIRYGHSELPVLDSPPFGGRTRPLSDHQPLRADSTTLVGMLSRRDVDKALQHGLGETSVREYVGASVPTSPPDTAVHELLRLMGSGSNRVVVTERDGRVCGIVTRGDVLESLHLQGQPVEQEVERLRSLPHGVQEVLRRCGEVGDEQDMNVFVVGGFVRDVMLGWENLDIDVVAEGDGILYARALAAAAGGRASTHEKFGTAVVVLPAEGTQPLKIDVASTRLEFYTRPAALPEVTGSTLKQDLFRRDFTINAMAIQLNPAHYGRLLDFFGARRDLREGVVRVLHNLSFIDDPTRIFRAIKFEQRCHFRMDPHTERLLRQAVKSKLLEALSPARVRDEFIQILSEARPLPAITRMAELRVLRLIHPRLQLLPRVRDLLEEITIVLAQYADMIRREDVQRWLVYFRGLVSGLSAEDIDEVAERYRVPTEARRRLFLDREQVRHMLRRLYRRKLLPSEVYRLLRPLSLEMVLYLMARARARSVKEKLVLYLDRLRGTKPIVTGRDLQAWGHAPGPAFGRVLAKLLDAQLDGKIHDLDEARAWLDEKDIVASWT